MFQRECKKLQEQAKEKYESTVGRPLKENRSPNGEQLNKIHTDKELAKLAGVGTVARYDAIMKTDIEAIGTV